MAPWSEKFASPPTNSAGNALVNDVEADLGEAIYVGLAGAEVALYGVLKQAENTVAVVSIVLGGINAPWAAIECARRGVS